MVMAGHPLPHFLWFPEFLEELSANRGMRTFDFVIDGFADIVE